MDTKRIAQLSADGKAAGGKEDVPSSTAPAPPARLPTDAPRLPPSTAVDALLPRLRSAYRTPDLEMSADCAVSMPHSRNALFELSDEEVRKVYAPWFAMALAHTVKRDWEFVKTQPRERRGEPRHAAWMGRLIEGVETVMASSSAWRDALLDKPSAREKAVFVVVARTAAWATNACERIQREVDDKRKDDLYLRIVERAVGDPRSVDVAMRLARTKHQCEEAATRQCVKAWREAKKNGTPERAPLSVHPLFGNATACFLTLLKEARSSAWGGCDVARIVERQKEDARSMEMLRAVYEQSLEVERMERRELRRRRRDECSAAKTRLVGGAPGGGRGERGGTGEERGGKTTTGGDEGASRGSINTAETCEFQAPPCTHQSVVVKGDAEGEEHTLTSGCPMQ